MKQSRYVGLALVLGILMIVGSIAPQSVYSEERTLIDTAWTPSKDDQVQDKEVLLWMLNSKTTKGWISYDKKQGQMTLYSDPIEIENDDPPWDLLAYRKALHSEDGTLIDIRWPIEKKIEGVFDIGISSASGILRGPIAFNSSPIEIENAWSPSKLQAFREAFIKDFKRSGLNTTPGDAALLRILIKAMNAKRGIEVGAASGYGAINMGMAFEHTGGHLYTIDIDAEMCRKTNANIQKMRLEKVVTCIEGDALKVIPKLEGTFDFVFIDAQKQDYFKYFKAIAPMLKPGAVIVADNVIQFEKQMKDFLDAMENDPDYDMVIIRASLEKGDGMAIIHKKQ